VEFSQSAHAPFSSGKRRFALFMPNLINYALFLLSFLDRVEGHYPFILLSFIIRIVEALGNAAFLTASFAIIAKEFPDNVATTFVRSFFYS